MESRHPRVALGLIALELLGGDERRDDAEEAGDRRSCEHELAVLDGRHLGAEIADVLAELAPGAIQLGGQVSLALLQRGLALLQHSLTPPERGLALSKRRKLALDAPLLGSHPSKDAVLAGSGQVAVRGGYYNEAMRTMRPVHDEQCSVACTADIIGSKWTAVIVHDLSEGARRFSELERSCPGISPRTLSERLRALEEEELVVRRSERRRVEYELTAKGEALLPIIDEMRRFGHEWLVPEHGHTHGAPAVPAR